MCDYSLEVRVASAEKIIGQHSFMRPPSIFNLCAETRMDSGCFAVGEQQQGGEKKGGVSSYTNEEESLFYCLCLFIMGKIRIYSLFLNILKLFYLISVF